LFLHDGASSEKLQLVQQRWFFAAIPIYVLAEQFDLEYNKSHSHVWPSMNQADQFKQKTDPGVSELPELASMGDCDGRQFQELQKRMR